IFHIFLFSYIYGAVFVWKKIAKKQIQYMIRLSSRGVGIEGKYMIRLASRGVGIEGMIVGVLRQPLLLVSAHPHLLYNIYGN
ncbi:MAG: hypothetical protein ACK559_01215, partial [bacterium]